MHILTPTRFESVTVKRRTTSSVLALTYTREHVYATPILVTAVYSESNSLEVRVSLFAKHNFCMATTRGQQRVKPNVNLRQNTTYRLRGGDGKNESVLPRVKRHKDKKGFILYNRTENKVEQYLLHKNHLIIYQRATTV